LLVDKPTLTLVDQRSGLTPPTQIVTGNLDHPNSIQPFRNDGNGWLPYIRPWPNPFDDPALAKSISFVNNAKTTMIMSTSGQLLTDGI
jgi:hypothetical protein